MIKSILKSATKVLSSNDQKLVLGGGPGKGPVCVRACCKYDPSCPKACWGGACPA